VLETSIHHHYSFDAAERLPYRSPFSSASCWPGYELSGARTTQLLCSSLSRRHTNPNGRTPRGVTITQAPQAVPLPSQPSQWGKGDRVTHRLPSSFQIEYPYIPQSHWTGLKAAGYCHTLRYLCSVLPRSRSVVVPSRIERVRVRMQCLFYALEHFSKPFLCI
jgi:hypothetical protein